MLPSIPPDVATELRERIDRETYGPEPNIPGLVYCAVNKSGDVIFNHASGVTVLGGSEPMTLDTTYWLASFTKLITGISCMQLVEQGHLALDDADLVGKLAPELRDVQVLEKQPNGTTTLVPKKAAITLRMLLTHTAGFGYAFSVSKLRDWGRPAGIDDFSGFKADTLGSPLVHQPGTAFEYGTGVDWAGVLIERVTGQSLDHYFSKNIFTPLRIKTISFRPTSKSMSQLAGMHHRNDLGKVQVRDHLYRAPLVGKKEDDQFCMGGSGCFGAPIEYCQIIATLLNDGTHHATGTRLLTKETVEEMFTDQIPHLPRHLNEEWESAKPDLSNPGPVWTYEGDPTDGWGLTFSLSHQVMSTGRAAGSASWEGLPNLFWFADRVNGVGGLIASQILPYGDKKVLQCSEDVEREIYKTIATSNCHAGAA